MSEVLLESKGVKKVFKGESGPLEVLTQVDLSVSRGDRVAILGRSGSGKSTLLHILGTLEAPSAGEIRFEGKNIFAFNEASLANFRNHHLGFVFQFHYLMLEFSALENVMMPALIAKQSKAQAEKRAGELLERVGLKTRLTHKPGQLSGGEQSRVAIARALMMGPKLLLTDEMTGNLDQTTGREVFALVQELHREFGMAMVSVTHDETLASTYSRIFRLQDGRLLAV